MRSTTHAATWTALLGVILLCLVSTSILHAAPQSSKSQTAKYNKYMKEAQALESTGQVPEAIERYMRASEIMPEKADPWASLSMLHIINKEPLMALNAADVAVMVEPNYKKAWVNKSAVELYAGRYDMALITTREALGRFPLDIQLLNNMATAQIYAGMLKDAEKTLKTTLNLSPNNATVMYNLACVFSLRSLKLTALTYLERAIAIDPSYKGKAKRDSDLMNIRNLNSFKALTQE